MPSPFDPITIGNSRLSNRIFMAAMTRIRAGQTHIPNDLMSTYYSQRATAGLIVTEATMIVEDGCAFIGEAGLYNDQTVDGWRRVTEAVHAKGGSIWVQLWHPGRAAHSALNGSRPVSSSDRGIVGETIRTLTGSQPYESPRRLLLSEIPTLVEAFRRASIRAMEAGFDGVQIHGAHGYLIDQFLRDSVNDRSDVYGGSIENRARLLLQVVDAASEAIGAAKVSVRISPLVDFNDISDSNPSALVSYVCTQLGGRTIAFLELRQAHHRLPADREIARLARQCFDGCLVLNGGYDLSDAKQDLADGKADAVAFASSFVANPDLVERFRRGYPLASPDNATLYASDAAGYTDYLPMELP